MKSTEYKAVDDSKLNDSEYRSSFVSHSCIFYSAVDGQAQHEAEQKDEELEGFLFGTLKQRHPDLQEQLEEFKGYLKESLKEIVELKAWQLQGQLFYV